MQPTLPVENEQTPPVGGRLAVVLSIFGRVASPSVVYLGTNVIRTALPFFLIPFLTKHLSPQEYGVAVLFQTVILFLAPFVPFNVHSAVSVEYYRRNTDELKTYLSSSCLPPAVICLVLMVSAAVAPSSWLGSTIPRPWLILAPLFGLTQLFPNLLLAIWQIEEKPVRFGAFSIAMAALNVGLSVTLVAGFHWGWRGRLSGILWSQALFSAIAFFFLWRQGLLAWRFSRACIRDVCHFCTPLIPYYIGGSVTDMGDRLIIAAQMSAFSLGQYTVAAQLGQTLVVFAGSLNQAWSPFLFRELTEITAERRREIVVATYAVAGVIVLAYGGLVVLAPVVAHAFIDRRYWSGLGLVPWFGLGYVFNGFYYLIGNYIFFAKQTRSLAVLTFSNAVVSVALTWFGVMRFGMMGAAWASALSWGIFFVAAWILSQSVLPMPWALSSRAVAGAPAADPRT